MSVAAKYTLSDKSDQLRRLGLVPDVIAQFCLANPHVEEESDLVQDGPLVVGEERDLVDGLDGSLGLEFRLRDIDRLLHELHKQLMGQ